MMDVPIIAEDSHTGKEYIKHTGIDSCIAPIVKALLDAGIQTTASCCGHGKSEGLITLRDGRSLIITKQESRENER